MKVGMALNMLCQPGRPDASVVHEHMVMGDLVEPLGFNSLFALEHHFTGYAMSPAPLQLLAYYAGRTKRIQLGTAVIVLPWHDPVRVAEQIALLDIMCGGRCLFGFGRGAASVEYEGFRIPMGEARPRFIEAAQIIKQALAQESFEFHGEYFQIPRTAIRPRPISHPERRFYGTAVSPDSVDVMAKLGFSMLVIMQNEWPKAAADIHRYRAVAAAEGFAPRPPMILTNVSCAESRAEAHERAMQWLGRKWESIDNHYHFSDGHLTNVKGYESLRKDRPDLRKNEGADPPGQGDRVLCQHPGGRHARRLHPEDRRTAQAQRTGPPDHRVLLWRHAARGGGNRHAPVRRQGVAGAATRCVVRRAGGRARPGTRANAGRHLRPGLIDHLLSHEVGEVR